jgi:conserved oligomeric Golgi complex subunit 6
MGYQQLQRIGGIISQLNNTCDEIKRSIASVQQESAPMLKEASALTTQRQDNETRQQLLAAFKKHFIVSDEDLTRLTSSVEPVDDRFFQIMERVKQIRKDCEVLLGTENQNLGIELMEQTSRNVDAAFKKLYNWIQKEFKALDLEDPYLSATMRRALNLLAERPAVFQNCLDFFAEAREPTLAASFHTALTEGSSGGGGNSVQAPANPIELSNHDLLRYTGDMLAWVHSTTIAEREALESLFISGGDGIAKQLQAGRDNEPWSRMVEDKDMPNGEPSLVFDGRKVLNDLVNRALEGVAAVLRQRIDIAVQSNEDPLLVYKALNLFRFYHDIFNKIIGTPSFLGNVIADLQSSSFSHFERLLREEASTIAAEQAAPDLSTPSFVLHALDQIQTLLKAAPTTSEKETSQLLSAALVPFLDQCAKMTEAIADATAQTIFQINYLSTLESVLRPLLPPDHSFLESARRKAAELRDELTETQHSFLLDRSGVGELVGAVTNQAPDVDTTPTANIGDSATLHPDALSNKAIQLDDFLPSALMDLLDMTKRVTDRTLAKAIVQEAAARFCTDFERLEDVILRVDEERAKDRMEDEDSDGNRGQDRSDGEDEEPESLRELYPRTTAEIKVLLS